MPIPIGRRHGGCVGICVKKNSIFFMKFSQRQSYSRNRNSLAASDDRRHKVTNSFIK